MLTAEDIKKITSVVATKKDLATIDTRISGLEISFVHFQHQLDETNERISSVEEKLDRHLVLIEKLIERVEAMRLEYAAIATQLSRHEEWIKEIAKKAGVKLEY